MEECCHIRINGTKCAAAALRDKKWCYVHDATYRERLARRKAASESNASRAILQLTPESYDYGDMPVRSTAVRIPEFAIDLPFLEDISSIQLAIARVIGALANGSIEPKRAGLLLYGLQIAAQNLPRQQITFKDTVSEIAQDEDGMDIATGKPKGEEEAPSLGRLLLAEVKRREEEREQEIAAQQAALDAKLLTGCLNQLPQFG
jgi:hypothetical protein